MGLDGRMSAALQSDRASRPRRVFLYDRDRYIYNDLTRRTGALVFSAAHAGELSFESPKIQNGVFTWEIVDALVSGKADVNRDGTITLDELQAYVSRNVAVKTGGLQRPTMDRDNIHQRFGFPVLRYPPLVRLTAQERGNVEVVAPDGVVDLGAHVSRAPSPRRGSGHRRRPAAPPPAHWFTPQRGRG